jgi:hypothetical protein
MRCSLSDVIDLGQETAVHLAGLENAWAADHPSPTGMAPIGSRRSGKA